MNHPFLQLPRYVSRVYPALALVLVLVGSGFLYNWQLTTITADSAVKERDSRIALLESENSALKKSETDLSSRLQTQNQTLASVETQLRDAKASLETQEKLLREKQAELSEASRQVASQQQQLSNTAAELEKLRNRPPLFSFRNESSRAGRESEKQAVQDLITKSYEAIQSVYGKPYLLNQVTITFVDNFSISAAAGETVITNGPQGISVDIRLRDFSLEDQNDVTTLIHELIHTFHGVAVFDDAALEEGITVAATDAVMEMLIREKAIPAYPNLYIIAGSTQLERWNRTLSVPAGPAAFYTSPDVVPLYQLVGAAWMELYRNDASFFIKFHNHYYPRIQRGEKPSAGMVLESIRAVAPKVNGIAINEFLDSRIAFNPK